MQIQALNPAQLQALIESSDFDQLSVVPISRHRAYSHIANPRAEADDVVMLMAMEGDEMLGYLGVLPDWVYLNGKASKGGWLSCMWVNPKTRGQGIGGKLVNAALEHWNKRILVTEFTPAAKRLYDRTEQFVDLTKPVGVRAFLRFNSHEVLPRKHDIFQKTKGLLQVADSALNIGQNALLQFWKPEVSVDWHYVESVDAEIDAFIHARQAQQVFRRTLRELNWMLRHPWVISGDDPDNLAERYHFSAIDQRFEFKAIRMEQNGQLAGFMILAIRNQHLKLPYCYLAAGMEEEALKLIFRHMKQERINMLSLFHPALSLALQQRDRYPFIHIRPLQRHYIISKVFEQDLGRQKKVDIQDGDADAAFT
ncbi:MAG: GNAT family N-acetyltransferase [Bacteroidota bacterium]